MNLDAGDVKRQHAVASPLDRLGVGPKLSVIVPEALAARLEAIAWWRRTSIDELLREAAQQLAARYPTGLPKRKRAEAGIAEIIAAA